jgi:ubiquinone/menaquinone biosynthesis C-methylase UbiE
MATAGLHFGSILEIGPGYGRVPLYLSHRRGMTCQHYIGVDISLNMLRELRRVATEYGLFGGAELSLACQSADSLPLPDDSVDFAMASAVFLHMGKDHVKRTMAEVARVLRPGGQVAFDTCFPNRNGSANRIEVWRTRLGLVRSAHHLKYWRRDELELALTASGLREKCPSLTVRSFSLQRWPKAIWRFRVPYARTLNAKVQHPAESQRDRYSVQYCAYDVCWADSLGPEAN